jgi:hypothetical protein
MMSTQQGLQTLFQREADKAEIIAALRHALDTQYRRFVQAARGNVSSGAIPQMLA